MAEPSGMSAMVDARRLPLVIRQFYVLVGGPSDTRIQRFLARDVLERWNRVHGLHDAVRLQPLLYELDARPTLTFDGQEAINIQLVDEAHAMIAIFHSKLGTPTPRTKEGGTVEEIFRLHRAGQEVMVYFSSADIPQANAKHLAKLKRFKAELAQIGLYAPFSNDNDLRTALEEHVERLAQTLQRKFPITVETTLPGYQSGLDSADEKVLLAIGDAMVRKDGVILDVGDLDDAEFADFEDSLEVLHRQGLIDRMEQGPLSLGFTVQPTGIRMYSALALPDAERIEAQIARLIDEQTASDVREIAELVNIPRILVERIVVDWRDQDLAKVSRTTDGTRVLSLGAELRRLAADSRSSQQMNLPRSRAQACINLLSRNGANTGAHGITLISAVHNEGDDIARDLVVEVFDDNGEKLSGGAGASALGPSDKPREVKIAVQRKMEHGEEITQELTFRLRASWRDKAGRHQGQWRVIFRGKGSEWVCEVDRSATIVPAGCEYLRY